MSDVAIVVPTLGRPAALPVLFASIAAATPMSAYRVIFVVDSDDEPTHQALATLAGRRIEVVECDGTFPEKTNAGVRASDEPLVLLTADDVVFWKGWLKAARRRFAMGAEVVGTVDCTPATRGRDHATMPIVTRDYVTDPGGAFGEPGKAFHEGYHHNFVETELCQLAQRRGVWAFAEDSIIEHRHHTWETRELDDTDRKGNLQHFDRDEALFIERKALWEAGP